MGNYSSSAGFFVAIGILAFLYCILTLVLYLGYQHLYREGSAAPVLDLIITGIFTFLWLVASSAWAKGLSDVKTNTSPNSLLSVATPCRQYLCTPGAVAAFGPLNSGVVITYKEEKVPRASVDSSVATAKTKGDDGQPLHAPCASGKYPQLRLFILTLARRSSNQFSAPSPLPRQSTCLLSLVYEL
ncbi:hypothetical protein NFI96_034719 [Prochilodus magdalenae]|nr:hypothetical protein NFI96_034719 [Prochilodus magdalenae]